WAFGLQELQPSFPPSLGNDLVHPAAHSKQFIRDMTHTLRLIPATTQKQPDGCFFDERKNRAHPSLSIKKGRRPKNNS
ncbi:MAG: hypothetical protein IJ198_03950, partial [Lachnospiraceae bacterium]|nr:hypothetical protein [Lachnospiraceae bacterium]